MRAIDLFSLKPVADAKGERMAQLLRTSAPSSASCIVPGAILEAQFETAQGFLLFTTQDVPFEEQLDICLLAPDMALRDRATLAHAYTTGTFADCRIESDSSLTFRFFGTQRLRIQLLDRPTWRLPWLGPAGVHRPLGMRRWFVVEVA